MVGNMAALVDLYDGAIKTMKASSQWTMSDKVPLFKEMLVPYFSVLNTWHEKIINKEDVQDTVNTVPGYLALLKERIVQNSSTDVRELSPSAEFSVAAAVLGSSTLFNRHLPVTLEDAFTLVHQKSIVLHRSIKQKIV